MKPEELISYLRALRSPSQQQQLLMLLSDKVERSKDDQRKLDALTKAELAARKAALARSKVTAILRDEEKAQKAEERKARTHRLIELGALVDLAGLGSWSRGEVLGALIAAANAEPDRRKAWKLRGDTVLASPPTA